MPTRDYVGRKVSSYFGENTFSFEVMKEKLPADIYARLERAVKHFEELPVEVADAVAAAIKEWALGKGATSYAHWFQPLTGLTAEKHDSFLSYGPSGRLQENFTGAKLTRSEPDASSFPHGGMRSTFEARGYAAWDPSSPAFILEGEFGKTLFIPSVFVSYDGCVLDKKTPLIKSIKAVSEASLRLLGLLGANGTEWVYPQLGPEQEYFLVETRHTESRPDLAMLGYTIFGSQAPRGQQFEDHYFGSIKDRVLAFMQESEIELYRLGIPAKTRHNEVAPNQFELATLHENANIATDHNQLLMEVLRKAGNRHGFTVLFHEKPFAGINGSGKHNNWSLVDSRGVNLLDPGATESDNVRFLCVVTAVLLGVRAYGDLFRAIVAGPGNDDRLGADEAPPPIMSVFLGSELTDVLERLERGKLLPLRQPGKFSTGVPFIPHFPRDATDRNRTSPIAFTGNKFEFRAVGASASTAMPTAVINAMVTHGLHVLADALERRSERAEDPLGTALAVVGELYGTARESHFEGDNYTPEWREEATRRGLFAAATAPEALEALRAPKNLDLFHRFHILTPEETQARYRVNLRNYIHTVELELRLAISMVRTLYVPGAVESLGGLLETASRARAAGPDLKAPAEALDVYAQDVAVRVQAVLERLPELAALEARLGALAEEECARFCADQVRPALREVRSTVDELERWVDARRRRVPGYADMLTIRPGGEL
ncbi:MAG: glutamine synthetase III [Acidobacteria bacterium]|nr:glutamine synthetase III [Acidobacteriota bacterium]